jgi:hypothetical protein
MLWDWYLGWTVMWELIGLLAVLAFAWCFCEVVARPGTRRMGSRRTAGGTG